MKVNLKNQIGFFKYVLIINATIRTYIRTSKSEQNPAKGK